MRAFQNKEWLIIAGLLLLVILLRLPSLDQPFDNDSAASAYHARLIVRGEPLYGTHHPDHHLPGTYYTYALAFLLFGDSLWSVKFLLILWTMVIVYLIYLLGKILLNKSLGILAAIFYAVLSSHVWMWGTSAQNELFANLPRVATILVLIYLSLNKSAPWKFVLVGVLAAISFLYKANYFSPLAVACLVLLVELWQNRANNNAWRTTLKKGLWIGVGFMLCLLLVAFYFGLLGLLPRLFLVFSLGMGYINRGSEVVSLPDRLWSPLLGLGINNAALLIFSLAGLLMIIVAKFQEYRRGRQSEVPKFLPYISVWYILTFIEASTSSVPFLHYYLLIVPPLALLAAWFLLTLYDSTKKQIRGTFNFVPVLLLIVLLAVTLLISVRQNFNYYYHYTRYKLGVETFQEFLLEGWPAAGQELVRVQELANYIKQHTVSSDRIYYWSIYLQVYYLTDRRSPIDLLWPRYVEATGSSKRIFDPQTKYIIVDRANMSVPNWLNTGLVKEYVLETVIQGQEVYRRIE